MKKIFFLILLSLFLVLEAAEKKPYVVNLPTVPKKIPVNQGNGVSKTCLSTEEAKLVELVNKYRRSRGLPALAAGRSLTHVAQAHVKDLMQNRPAGGRCNMHSWSSKGKWTACCYTRDHKQAKCMWRKPQELTSYRGNGFEIAYGSSRSRITAASALKGWQGSPGHNAVMTNSGMWKRPWGTMGVGLYGGYSVIWFGNEKDPAGVAPTCSR